MQREPSFEQDGKIVLQSGASFAKWLCRFEEPRRSLTLWSWRQLNCHHISTTVEASEQHKSTQHLTLTREWGLKFLLQGTSGDRVWKMWRKTCMSFQFWVSSRWGEKTSRDYNLSLWLFQECFSTVSSRRNVDIKYAFQIQEPNTPVRTKRSPVMLLCLS